MRNSMIKYIFIQLVSDQIEWLNQPLNLFKICNVVKCIWILVDFKDFLRSGAKINYEICFRWQHTLALMMSRWLSNGPISIKFWINKMHFYKLDSKRKLIRWYFLICRTEIPRAVEAYINFNSHIFVWLRLEYFR